MMQSKALSKGASDGHIDWPCCCVALLTQSTNLGAIAVAVLMLLAMQLSLMNLRISRIALAMESLQQTAVSLGSLLPPSRFTSCLSNFANSLALQIPLESSFQIQARLSSLTSKMLSRLELISGRSIIIKISRSGHQDYSRCGTRAASYGRARDSNLCKRATDQRNLGIGSLNWVHYHPSACACYILNAMYLFNDSSAGANERL